MIPMGGLAAYAPHGRTGRCCGNRTCKTGGRWPAPASPARRETRRPRRRMRSKFMQETVVDVYWTDLDEASVDFGRFADMLADDEHGCARQFRFEQDRRRYIVRRGRLRELLSRYLGTSPPQVRLRAGPFGKPGLAEGDVRFSLSHSHGIALFAIVRGLEVGCDIEHRDRRFAFEQIAEQFFSPLEARILRLLPAARQAEAFFNCWTRKEAYVKARGLGLSLPLNSFDVSLAPSKAAVLLRGCEGWSVQAFEPVPFYHAAVVVQGDNWRLSVPERVNDFGTAGFGI